MVMKYSILYLCCNPGPCDYFQKLTFAGIRRYADTRKWNAVVCRGVSSRTLAGFLEANRPVAGCVIDCAADHGTLLPRVFGKIPVVYLHAAPLIYGRRIARVEVDHEAVARTAFHELSAGIPSGYAVVGDYREFSWSVMRERHFRSIAAKAGAACRRFPRGIAPEARVARLTQWVSALPCRTAIFAVNDLTAAEVVAAARASGRAIPGELTLCGMDNVREVCESVSPTITSIQRDVECEGYVAAKMLVSRVSGAVPVGPLMSIRRESTLGARKSTPHILSAVETIRCEACSGLTARDIIDRSPGSRSLFNLRFRETMGHSVHDEIEHVRLEKVFTLLSCTDTDIGAIASMCGYRSGIALHKAFRLRTGMSMREWRAHNRCKG